METHRLSRDAANPALASSCNGAFRVPTSTFTPLPYTRDWPLRISISFYTTTLKITGRRAPPPRPTTPTDQTLASRPVPRKKAFPVLSFGPGTTIDTSPAAFNNWNGYELQAYWKEFECVAAPSLGEDLYENARLLQEPRHSEACVWRDDGTFTPQPTWGYYVFLTDYDQVTKDSLPCAVENWVEVTRRS